jgi:hypothetical protein
MTAPELLEALRTRGVTLEAVGDRLRFRPRGSVTPDLRAALVARKREILALLVGAADRSSWPAALPDLGPKTVGPFAACDVCQAATWVRYGTVLLCRPCAVDPAGPATVAYRGALEQWWALDAQGPDADHASIAEAVQQLARLADEVGEPRATALRRRWARERGTPYLFDEAEEPGR